MILYTINQGSMSRVKSSKKIMSKTLDIYQSIINTMVAGELKNKVLVKSLKISK